MVTGISFDRNSPVRFHRPRNGPPLEKSAGHRGMHGDRRLLSHLHVMSHRGFLSYFWKEHLHPYFVAIPLLPFMFLFFPINMVLKRIPDGAVTLVRFALRVVFGAAFVCLLCVGTLSLLDYFGFIRFDWLHQVTWRPFAELVLIWLAGGMFTFYTMITHGNWQIRKPVA